LRVLFEFWPCIVPIQNLMHLNQHGIQMATQMLGFDYKIIPNPRHLTQIISLSNLMKFHLVQITKKYHFLT